MGLLVLTKAASSPVTSLYNVIADASHPSKMSTIVENLNINTGVNYNATTKELTVTFDTSATIMQAEFYCGLS